VLLFAALAGAQTEPAARLIRTFPADASELMAVSLDGRSLLARGSGEYRCDDATRRKCRKPVLRVYTIGTGKLQAESAGTEGSVFDAARL
jgi:hypothetical protein